MSQKAIGWALSKTGISWQAKFVLVLLAHHHDESTGFCNPTKSILAEQSGFPQQMIGRYTKQLKDIGFIKKRPRYDENDAQIANHYWLQMENDGVAI